MSGQRTVLFDCRNCGKSFEVVPSRVRHGRARHCSPACQYESIRRAPKRATACTCIGCGAAFSRPPSRMHAHRGAGKYCSRACRDKHWKGPLNPNWQNGAGVYKRGPHWHATRRRIVARDKVCQCCGAGEPLHVHHKIPFRMFDDPVAANDDGNLIALCPPCHRRADAQHKWVKIGSNIICMSAGSYAWQLARARGLISPAPNAESE